MLASVIELLDGVPITDFKLDWATAVDLGGATIKK